ncbi:Sugar (and other) transporter-like protein 21 [Elsinoe fawcettii]|nr:Sugar (and other) transporter-like protein 21 [Elsinoe fawcettii]
MVQVKRPNHNRVIEAQEAAPEIPRVKWTASPNMRKLYFYCAILCVCSATTGYDGSLMNTSQLLDSWQNTMGKPSEDTLGRLSAMYSIGSIASLPVVPFLSDRFGRKIPITAGCVIMIVAAAVQAASMSRPQYEGARFFMGFGNSMAQLSCPMLITEIAHPQHRARITTIYNCLWNLGALICGWLAFGTQHINSTWSWRIPTLLQGIFSVIQLAFIFWIPESPRWLLSKDRNEEALQMLAKYHADGNDSDATVMFEYAEMKETLRMEFLHQKSSSYMDFIKTKGNRMRLMIIVSLGLFSQWSGNALVSYYAGIIYKGAGVTGQTQLLGLDAGNKVLSLIVSISCALLVDRVGRRPLFLAATGGMLLFLVLATITGQQFSKTGKFGIGYVNIVFVWLHGVSYALAWSGLLVAYTVEILPYKLRAKGVFVMNLSVQVALTINNYLNPIPISEGGGWYGQNWKLFACYAGWVLLELIWVYYFYVETRGPTLEEIARIFDGDEAQVADIDIGGKITNRHGSVDLVEEHHAEKQ